LFPLKKKLNANKNSVELSGLMSRMNDCIALSIGMLKKN